jgi:hypothetical protein
MSAEMDGRDIDGNRIQVERAKGPRAGQGRSSGQRTDFRLRVENLSRDVSWQDLKVNDIRARIIDPL